MTSRTAGRGAFIVFEGIDRCGKSTQAQQLVDNLQLRGIAAQLWRFPDRQTTIGHMINNYLANKAELDDHVIHLLFAANRWEKRQELLQVLESGVTVVSDRYSYSGVAFSAAKGMDQAWCEAPEVGLPSPDAVFYLQLSIEEAMARGGFGQERYEKEEMQRQVRSLFEAWSTADNWKVFAANQTIEQLQEQLLQCALQLAAHCKEKAPPLQLMTSGAAGTSQSLQILGGAQGKAQASPAAHDAYNDWVSQQTTYSAHAMLVDSDRRAPVVQLVALLGSMALPT